MAEVSYYTKDGLEKLKEELQRLKTTGRADISKAIAEARDKGDLSENAEYDAAKEAQGLHEAKIAQMQETLANARLLDDPRQGDRIAQQDTRCQKLARFERL